MTLLDNVLHAGGPNGENATDPTTSLDYTITDADGSLDDRHADHHLRRRRADGDGGGVAERCGGRDGHRDAGLCAGADGATVTHINGTALVFNPADSNYSQAIDIGDGSIKVKADGSYSFTADNPTIEPGAAASATFTVTDGDGDTATATGELPGYGRQRADGRDGVGGG